MIRWTIKSFDKLTSIELYKILQLRINVFMLEQNCLYPECDDKDIQANHLFADDNGQIIAYARLIAPQVSYKEASIGRVIVSNQYRGQKLGYTLMQYAIEKLSTDYPMSAIRISAQAHLNQFYGNVGFKQVSKEYLEDGIPHIEMILQKEE